MKIFNFVSKNQAIHFIGICGVSMSALAKFCKNLGYIVTGSDVSSKNLDNLASLGIQVNVGHRRKNVIGCSLVIYSSAISDDNEELLEARKNGIPIMKRSELLGQIIKSYKHSVGVAGSHGKTTATAMIARIMIEANKNPTIFLGGNDKKFGNFRSGDNEIAIAEVCEYKKNLLDVSTSIAVILNIDNDHLDSYINMQDMIDTFSQFAQNSLLVINSDDKNASKIYRNKTLTFGIKNEASVRAKNVRKNQLGYSFTVYSYGKKLGRIHLKVFGKHNIYNALSAITVATFFGIDFCLQKKTLENFYGVERRNEYLGMYNKINFYTDYAHHPKEISATLTAFKQNRIEFRTVFQPHTFSRTEYLMQDFIDSLINEKNLIIYDTYSARENYNQNGSAKTLYINIKKKGKKDVYFAKNKSRLKKLIEQKCNSTENILFLGAGDIYDIAKSFIQLSYEK